MSIIIPTFVLSVVNTETGSGNTVLAEARLQPALIYNKKKTITQGVSFPHLLNGSITKIQIIIEMAKHIGTKKFPTE